MTSHTLTPVCLYPCTQNLAYEIILTLGQAFEVAYQLALQARKSGHGSSTLPESFDSKPSKPVPKPRVNIRKSVSITGSQAHHCLKGGSILNTSNLALFSDVAMIWILYAWQLFSDLDVLSNMFMMNSPFDTQLFSTLEVIYPLLTKPIPYPTICNLRWNLSTISIQLLWFILVSDPPSTMLLSTLLHWNNPGADSQCVRVLAQRQCGIGGYLIGLAFVQSHCPCSLLHILLIDGACLCKALERLAWRSLCVRR